MSMGAPRYRGRKAKKTIGSGIVETKIVRVDERTLIEVPVHISDAVAIERFLQRKKLGPKPPTVYPKVEDEEEPAIPDILKEMEDDLAEQEEDEEGDD